MFRNKFVAMVVPAHNESRHIAKVIESTPRFVDMLMVVDDGSSDATSDVVRSIRDPRVTLLRHNQNRGVGAAIVTGYRCALERGADLIGVMGGDGQMDTAQLPALLEPVINRRCDFTKGNRFFSWRSWRGMPLERAIGNIILSVLTKAASGYWHVFDAQNGYTMISAAMLRRLPLERLETGYQFENRLLILLNASGARVCDVRIPARYGDEESGIKLWRDVPAILWTLLTGFWMRIRHKYLHHGLSLPGILFLSSMLLVGFGGAMAISGWFADVPSWVPPTAAFCVALSGGLLGFFIVTDVINSRKLRPRSESEGELPEVMTAPQGATMSTYRTTVSRP